MKPRIHSSTTALFLGLSLLQPAFASDSRPAAVSSASVFSEQALASKVHELYNSPSLSRAKKEKQIATLVRVTVVAATAYTKTSGEALMAASALASAAARQAPDFLDVIVKAAALSPVVSKSPGATEEIRAAAIAARRKPAQKLPRAEQPRAVAEVEEAPAKSHETLAPGVQRQRLTKSAVTRVATAPVASASSENAVEGEPSPARSTSRQRISNSDGKSNVSLKADVSVQFDDNVYLSKEDKKSDIIYTLSPGIAAEYGRNSRAHGEASYSHSFTQYVDKSSSNVGLDNADAKIGYEGNSVTFSIYGQLVQTNQNNRDVLSNGLRSIYRTDEFTAGLNTEVKVFTKTSLGTVLEYNSVNYPDGGLVSNHSMLYSEKFYFELRPKFDLFAGVSLRDINYNKGSNNVYYFNTGIRGNITPLLTSNFSVGYRSSKTKDFRTTTPTSGSDGNLGFEGSLEYSLAAKSTVTLSLSNDFGTSANGDTTRNGDYILGFSTQLTNQLQTALSFDYRTIDYGSVRFLTSPTTSVERVDHFFQTSLSASYQFTRWFNASLAYSFRSNQSTLDAVEFGNNLLSLRASLKY